MLFESPGRLRVNSTAICGRACLSPALYDTAHRAGDGGRYVERGAAGGGAGRGAGRDIRRGVGRGVADDAVGSMATPRGLLLRALEAKRHGLEAAAREEGSAQQRRPARLAAEAVLCGVPVLALVAHLS